MFPVRGLLTGYFWIVLHIRIGWMGWRSKKNVQEGVGICMHMTDWLCCTEETNNIVKQVYSSKEIKDIATQILCCKELRNHVWVYGERLISNVCPRQGSGSGSTALHLLTGVSGLGKHWHSCITTASFSKSHITHTHAHTDTHTYTLPPSSPTALQAKLITDTFVFSEIKISFISPSPWFVLPTGLVKNFIWVFHKMLWKNLNKFSFWPNQYSFRCLAVPLGPKFLESRGQIFILIFKKPKRC